MALIGGGQGFKLLIGMVVVVVALSVPIYFMDLELALLSLARRTDGSYAPVEVVIDRQAKTVRVSTQLSGPVPPELPLSAHVKLVDANGNMVAEFVDQKPLRAEQAGVIHINGPLFRSQGWDLLEARILLLQSKLVTGLIHGYLPPAQTNLEQVDFVRDPDELPVKKPATQPTTVQPSATQPQAKQPQTKQPQTTKTPDTTGDGGP